MSSTTTTAPSPNAKLLQPIQVGRTTLQQRIAFLPLTRLRNDEDNVPAPFKVKYYADRAVAAGTLVISEATGVSRNEIGMRNGPGFCSDDQQAAWAKIIEAVHAKGSFWFQQLWGMGRAADPKYVESRGYTYHSSSASAMGEGEQTPVAMTEAEILQFIDDFVASSKRVIAAGGDGVEVHGAHGYLIDQFLSDHVNKRTDKWGGSVENRARLLLEVVKAVSAAIGADRVGLRLSPYASFQAATKSDVVGTYTYIIQELKKLDLNLAYLSLVETRGDPAMIFAGSGGGNDDETLDFILEAWDNKSPVIVAGAYTPELAVTALESHYAKWDVIIGFGRWFLSTPDLVFRVKNGIPLNPYNRSTFYLPMSEEGYNDYPFSEEFLKAHLESA